MSMFTTERLFVPLDDEDDVSNRALARSLRSSGVHLSIGANATELIGIKAMLRTLSQHNYTGTFADTHYNSVGGNIYRSLQAFEKLHSIGYVSIDGRAGENSLCVAAEFNSGLQVVAKAIDSNMSEEEYSRRFGRSIENDTLSICETAEACGIGAIMLAGADVKLVADRFPDMKLFATGIRTKESFEGAGTFVDDQLRVADPVDVLEAGGDNVNLMVGRLITTSVEPDIAVSGLQSYINKG